MMTLIKKMLFEIAVASLLIITVCLVSYEGDILKTTMVLSPAGKSSVGYINHIYADEPQGGNTVATITGEGKWECQLGNAYAYPFCGYEFLFDGQERENGVDLSNFDNINVTVRYEGPGDTLRMYLKNYDERYSKLGVRESAKFNMVEWQRDGNFNKISIALDDFGVADWWLQQNRVAPHLSHTQFDNIVSLEFQTGSGAPVGLHKFEVIEVELVGRIMPTTTWYAMIMGVWVVLIFTHLVCRLIVLSKKLKKKQLMVGDYQNREAMLTRRANTDHLTNVLNRHGIESAYNDLCNDRREGDNNISVMLMDIDHFKSINDEHGHDVGDDVLSAFASLLGRNLRGTDIIGRWGGEEFVVICKHTDEEKAMFLGEKIRTAVENFNFITGHTVTVSIGVVSVDSPAGLEGLVKSADVALYAAKENGRNQVVHSNTMSQLDEAV